MCIYNVMVDQACDNVLMLLNSLAFPFHVWKIKISEVVISLSLSEAEHISSSAGNRVLFHCLCTYVYFSCVQGL